MLRFREIFDPEAHLRRLLPVVLPLLLTSCAKPEEEVIKDVRSAIHEVSARENISCGRAQTLAGAILDGRGYSEEGSDYFARGATVSTKISESGLVLDAQNAQKDRIIWSSTPCKQENLPQ